MSKRITRLAKSSPYTRVIGNLIGIAILVALLWLGWENAYHVRNDW